jgi:hypothetical protein
MLTSVPKLVRTRANGDKKRIFAVAAKGALLLLLLGAFFIWGPARRAHADAGSIVINEIMYNPSSGIDNDEFLELYNTTASPVDMSGWCFTAGVTLCFAPGTTIGAHEYKVVSPNSPQTLTTYSVVALANYTGKLDNGGETVTLRDGPSATTNAIVDTVKYDDDAPWPTTPDGGGPSLELKDHTSDHMLPVSWGASIIAPTPGQVNSVTVSGLPDITDVVKPNATAPSTAATVTARITNSTSAELIYQVNFDGDQTVQMYDDGAHGDGPASDGVFGASVPGQSAGDLVRYRVEAANGNGDVSKPGNDETIHYYGYVVTNPAVTTQLPVVQWFIPDADYDDLVTNHNGDDFYFKAVVANGNEVFDNVDVRVKGEYSLTFPKKSFKFELPKGYMITIPGYADEPVSQFHLNGDWAEPTGALTTTAWWAAKQAGVQTTQIFKARLQRNGQFEGLYTFAEKYDKNWRTKNDFQSGAFYEDRFEKSTRLDENSSDIDDWFTNSQQPISADRRNYVLNNDNIPNMLNVAAVESIIKGHDWSMSNNMMSYRDTDGTGRWSLLPWDFDLLMFGSDAAQSQVSPYDRPGYVSALDRAPLLAVYDEPDMKQMYFRRLRTLTDMLYANDQYLNHFIAEEARVHDDAVLNYARWGGQPAQNRDEFYNLLITKIKERKSDLLARFRAPWAIPAAQSSEDVVFDSVDGDANTANQYIRLKNNSSEYIDITGWHIDGLDYSIPAGTVIPSGGTVIFLKNDTAYRSAHGGNVFVGGQYKNNLATLGDHTLTLKNRSGDTIDTEGY